MDYHIDMSSGIRIIQFAAAMVLLVVSIASGRPKVELPATTRPMGQDVFAPPSQDRWDHLINDLSGDEASSREAAREALMLLRRTDLDALLAVVKERKQLSVAQRIALRDIVCHVYLTGLHNFQGETTGRLGVMGMRRSDDMDRNERLPSGPGAAVDSRVPGFDAYRVLRDGDLIVGVKLLDATGKGQVEFVSIFNFDTLARIILQRPTGDTVELRVLRSGRIIDISTRLGPYLQRERGQVLLDVSDQQQIGQANIYWKLNWEEVVRSDIWQRPSS